MTTQTIIVGQGTAGSILAWKLHQRGHAVRVIDDGHRTSSSRVAGGMINPVQGQRLSLAWRIEDCLPAARAFFREIADFFGQDFFHEAPILRLIDSTKEAEFLEQRRGNERYEPFLGKQQAAGSNAMLADELGSMYICQSGYVDTNAFLDCLRDFFQEQHILCTAEFHHDEVEEKEGFVRWRELEAEQIIFAEGFRILDNPWFQEFNFQPNKGEIITLSANLPFPEHPVNRGKWIIPLPDGSAWCGSTYGRGQTDMNLTDKGRNEIFDKAQAILPEHTMEVIGHRAGVRCATGDHIPRAGFHPDHPRIGVFNGFGSKGNVFAPWLAEQLANHICQGAALPIECDFATRPPRRKR